MRVALIFDSLLLVLSLCSTSVVGVLHKQEWIITWEAGAPNGQERDMIKVNGQFPGPAVICDEDDDIEITVHNQMPFNTSIHWHGLEMYSTPWSDGAPGMSQKPIEQGQSFIYRFKASPSGTHWYHSHSRVTLLDGLYGPIHIRHKSGAPAPWELISQDPVDIETMAHAAKQPHLMLVSDWMKFTSWEFMKAVEESRFALFCSDSILINGKGSVFCPGVDYLIDQTSTYMKYVLYPRQVSDKGCFPLVRSTEGPFLWAGNPAAIPADLNAGCIPSEGTRELVEVDPGDKWASLNFIGASTMKTLVFSVDAHDMWVYEVDGHYIHPQRVNSVHMHAGERYAVMIKLDQRAQDYTIRVADNGRTQIISAFATLRYKGGTHTLENEETLGLINYGGQNRTPSIDVIRLNQHHLPPYPPNPPARHADAMHVMHLHRWGTPWRYTVTGYGPLADDNTAYAPLLYDPRGADALDPGLVIRTKNGSWVDLVLQVGSQPGQPIEFHHMMHKHTGKTWRIGEGMGLWNYSSVDEAMAAEPDKFDLETPSWRDIYVTSFDGPAWMVLRYQVTNPGPWLFHCHIETHLAGGMAMVILDGVDAWPAVPPEYGPDQRGYKPGTLPELEAGVPVSGVAQQSAAECNHNGGGRLPSPSAVVAGAKEGHGKSGCRSFVGHLIEFLKAWAPEETS